MSTSKLVIRWATSRSITEWTGSQSQPKRDSSTFAFLVLIPTNGTFQKCMMPRPGNPITYSLDTGIKWTPLQSMAPKNTGNTKQTLISNSRLSLIHRHTWFKRPWKVISHSWNYTLNSKVICPFAINLADQLLFIQYQIVTYNLPRCFVSSLKYSSMLSSSQILL